MAPPKRQTTLPDLPAESRDTVTVVAEQRRSAIFAFELANTHQSMKQPHSDIHLHTATPCVSALLRGLLALCMVAAVGCTTSNSQLVPDKGFSSQLGGQHILLGQVYRGPARVTRDALFSALGHARYVVLGETHDNRDHHQLQAQLVQQFLAAQPGAAVAFEMLDEDDTGALSAQTASELEQRVDWANSGWPDFALYRPVFDAAFSAHARVVAAHPSTEHVRASMQGVAEAEARALHIDQPLPEAQIQAQHDEIRESHCGHAPDQMLTAMQRAQVYKDAFMARAVTQTHVPTVLIAGRGHARNDRAVPYFLKRAGSSATLSIAFIEVEDGREDPSTYDTEAFDYVIFTPRASNEDPCEKFRKQLEQMRQHPGGG
jgi:uncharacterized iron-regulated protein